jgi:uncharacterized RDD family membrane protein YckC
LTLPADDQTQPAVEGAPAPAASLLPPGLVFADVYTRFAAYFLDGLLLSALISIPPAALGLYDYAATYPPQPMPRATYIGTTIFGLAVQAAYFLWFWTGGRRATPGQRVFNVQVGNAFDGRPLTMSQGIARWLGMGWWLNGLTLLPYFGLAVVGFVGGIVWWVVLGISIILSPTKQGIHDRIARSALVRPAGPPSRWAVGCVWLFVALVVIEIVLIAMLVSMVAGFRDSGLFPPGMDPLELFLDQFRDLWPS